MLDKAIEHGKEHRRKYRKSKAFDRTCRNHGSCKWCEDDRMYSSRKRLAAARAEKRESFIDEDDDF